MVNWRNRPLCPSRSRQGSITACCAHGGNHLIGKLDITALSRSTRPARCWQMRLASSSIRMISGKSRRSVAARRGSRSSAMIRSGGQPARSRPRVKLPVPAPSSSTGPGLASSMQRASASARRALLGLVAAICNGFCSQRQKKAIASAAMRLLALSETQRTKASPRRRTGACIAGVCWYPNHRAPTRFKAFRDLASFPWLTFIFRASVRHDFGDRFRSAELSPAIGCPITFLFARARHGRNDPPLLGLPPQAHNWRAGPSKSDPRTAVAKRSCRRKHPPRTAGFSDQAVTADTGSPSNPRAAVRQGGGGMTGDAREHVGELGLWVDVVELGDGDQSVHRCCALATAIGSEPS